MRILRVTSSGWPEGGAESNMLLLDPMLAARGHEVRTLASDLMPDEPHFNDYSFRHVRPDGPGKYIRRIVNVDAARQLRRVLRDYDPDVVDVHTMGQTSASVLFALGQRPTTLTVHGPETFTRALLLYSMPPRDFVGQDFTREALTPVGRARYAYLRWFGNPVFRLGLRRVDEMVTVSRYMQQLLAPEGLHCTIVPPPIPPLPWSEGDPTRARLLYAGRLTEHKGVDHVIAALASIRAQLPSASLRIAGEGADEQRLARITRAAGLSDAVHFLGQLPAADLQREYREASLVVMPSVWPEAFGKVGVEAQSAGRPVVATRVGGVQEWLEDGVTGRLVPPADPAALAGAVLDLLTDVERYRRMSADAATGAARFSPEAHLDAMERTWHRAIAAHARGRA